MSGVYFDVWQNKYFIVERKPKGLDKRYPLHWMYDLSGDHFWGRVFVSDPNYYKYIGG